MSYVLRDHVSFCNADGRLVFLDIRKDRYFRLPNDLESGLLTYLDDRCGRNPVLDELVKIGVLVFKPGISHLSSPIVCPPARSALEHSASSSILRRARMARATRALLTTRLQLKFTSLESTLRQLAAYRRMKIPPSVRMTATTNDQALLQATAEFMRVSRLFSTEGSCLPNSIALARFLAGEGLPVDVVLGVTGVPFSAHCWAQVEDIVLNDFVGNVQAHTPILVI